MRFLTDATLSEASELDMLIDAEMTARDRIDVLAPRLLLRVMEEHGWAQIVVDPEHLSLVEAIIVEDGTHLQLSEMDLDEINDEAISVVGQCPPRMFPRGGSDVLLSRNDITTWLERNGSGNSFRDPTP